MGSSKLDQKVKNHHARIRKNRRKESTDITIEKRMQEIEKVIMFNTYKYGGIGLVKLASLTGLDRKSLGPYLKKLIAAKKVHRRGKKGRYSSINVDSSDFSSSSLALGQMFMNLYKVKAPAIENNDYYHVSFNHTPLEKSLFELSNRIGAYLIFLFIESMNPNNRYIPDRNYDDLLSGDSLSIQWVTDSFSTFIDSLTREFREIYLRTVLDDRTGRDDLVELGLYRLECQGCNTSIEHYSKNKLWELGLGHEHHMKWYKIECSGLKKSINEPTTLELYQEDKLILTKKLIDKLKQKFKLVYPILSEVFEKFMLEIPNQIKYNDKQWKDHIEYDELNEIDRLRCKHHYSKILNVGKYQYKECSKCHHTIPKNFKVGDVL